MVVGAGPKVWQNADLVRFSLWHNHLKGFLRKRRVSREEQLCRRKKSCWCWVTEKVAEWLQVTSSNKLIWITTCYCWYASTLLGHCGGGEPRVPLLADRSKKIQATTDNIQRGSVTTWCVACHSELKSLRNVSSTWSESMPEILKALLEAKGGASDPEPDQTRVSLIRPVQNMMWLCALRSPPHKVVICSLPVKVANAVFGNGNAHHAAILSAWDACCSGIYTVAILTKA